MIEDDPAVAPILAVARALGPVVDELTLVGGAVARLLITDPAAEPVRPTVDVDAIVAATSYVDYERLGRRVEACGFSRSHRPGDPVCRWRAGQLVLDLMPVDEDVLKFGNRWYRSAVLERRTRRIAEIDLHHVDGPHFLATKLEAYHGRGNGDPLTSADLEDVIRVVDGRAELLEELEEAPLEVRHFVSGTLEVLLHHRHFVEALPTYFEAAGTARSRILLTRLRDIAESRA